jgi:hypothetical protein
MFGKIQIVERLIKAGADFNILSPIGMSPLRLGIIINK